MEIIKYNNTFRSFYLFEVDEIDSTNSFFKRNYALYPSNSVLIAKKQTAGRGRFNRVWISDNDITFSILVKKKICTSLLIPISVVDSLKAINIDSSIKWPNDVYVKNNKIAGILVEEIYEGSKFIASIIGIGINITNKKEFNGIGISQFCEAEKNDIILSILANIEENNKKSEENILVIYSLYSIILHQKICYKKNEYIVQGFTKDGYIIASNNFEKIEIKSNEIDIKTSLQ